ncbi:MAG: 1-acyl-sn-glycerol-3-phosphate acyltransferase [Chitinophagaceae bacterium]|nr:1-acyl-sn-glycerol-3-phosphate acyltransferase [Chitinophagaceae bacterium]
MRYLLFFPRLIYSIYAILLFLLLMLVVMPLVVVASLFGKINGGNFIFRLCSLWADCWFLLIGVFHRNIYEASHNKKDHFIFVTNHISYFDAPIIVKTFRQPLRVLGKIEMARIPIFGFIYRNAIVTVDRSSAINRARSVRVLKSVLQKGISIFLFPEGTFNITHQPLKDFFDGAFRIAIETQTPIKPVLFLDAYDRMNYHSIFSLTPGRCRSVFLEEISVDGLKPADLNQLKEKVHTIMSKKLVEYRASWVRNEQKISPNVVN